MENIIYVNKDHTRMLTADEYNHSIRIWENSKRNLKELCNFLQEGIYACKVPGSNYIKLNSQLISQLIIDIDYDTSFNEVLQEVSSTIIGYVNNINDFNPDDYDKYQFMNTASSSGIIN